MWFHFTILELPRPLSSLALCQLKTLSTNLASFSCLCSCVYCKAPSGMDCFLSPVRASYVRPVFSAWISSLKYWRPIFGTQPSLVHVVIRFGGDCGLHAHEIILQGWDSFLGCKDLLWSQPHCCEIVHFLAEQVRCHQWLQTVGLAFWQTLSRK